MTPPLGLWLQAYGLTLVVETAVARAWIREASSGWVLGWSVLATTLTHPALWYLAPRFEPYWLWVGVMEVLVTAVEAGVWAVALGRAGEDLPGRRGMALAVVCNGASLAVGLAWASLGGWG